MLKNISNLGKSLTKVEQREIQGGFGGGLPIAGFCVSSLNACLLSCTRPGTECAPCADNNAVLGTYECRVSGLG